MVLFVSVLHNTMLDIPNNLGLRKLA